MWRITRLEKSKIETYIGFCIRSGKIIFGTEMISRQKKGVKLLISDGGMGANSFKIMVNAYKTLACPLLQTEAELLGKLVHRPTVKAVAIKDEHLASAILSTVADDPQFKLYSGGNN